MILHLLHTTCWVDYTALGSLTGQYDEMQIQYVLHWHGLGTFMLGCWNILSLTSSISRFFLMSLNIATKELAFVPFIGSMEVKMVVSVIILYVRLRIQRNWVFATNANFIIPKSQQSDVAYLPFIFQTYIVWSTRIHSLKYIYGLRHLVLKKLGFKNPSLWQKLNSFNLFLKIVSLKYFSSMFGTLY